MKNHYSKEDYIEMAEEILDNCPYDLAQATDDYASISGLNVNEASILYETVCSMV